MLTATLAFYLPASRRSQQKEVGLDRANEKIGSLESQLENLEAQIETLSSEQADLEKQLEEDKQKWEEELQLADLHVHILSALADVTAAQLSLVLEDPDATRLALTNTPDTLESLAGLVGAEQIEAVTAMQQRLDLTLNVIVDDPDAAQSDLEVLATNLVKLENTFFVSP